MNFPGARVKSMLTMTVAALVLGWTGPGVAQPADPGQVLSGLPGFDFSRLSAPARRALVTVLTDEFDACGRPLTLLASVKKGDACKHTRRVVDMAATMAQAGTGADEIIVTLSRHNQSFLKPRVDVSAVVDQRSCLGPPDARVTLVEFSDFECPYCAVARTQLKAFERSRKDVRVCWAAFPLPMHPNGTLCAQAAMYARDQDKFWPVHDGLFDNQQGISPAMVRSLVKTVGLDLAGFEKVVATGKYVDEITRSKDLGRAAGVDGTPSIFVNGRRHMLGLDPDGLALSVDDELDWMANRNGWSSN